MLQNLNRENIDEQIKRLVSFFVGLNGVWALATTVILRLHRFGTPFPIRTQILSRTASLLIGIFLIYFAFQLRQGKRSAWWVALIGTIAIIFSQFTLNHKSYFLLILPNFILVIMLLASKEMFKVRSDIISLRRGLIISATIALAALTYGVFGFMMLDRPDFHTHDFGVIEALRRSLQQFFLIGNSDLRPHTLHAQWFLNSLSILGASSLGLIALSLFRPFRLSFKPANIDYQIAQAILRLYSKSPEDFFKLWPQDKHFFFDPLRRSFVAYRVELGVALVLDDPSGPKSAIPALIADFFEFCRINGWSVAFVHVSPQYLPIYEDFKMHSVKIGQEAFIDLTEFNEITTGSKHFRYIRNKFSQDYLVEIAKPPHSPELLQKLRQISDQWLSQPNRQERGFALGYFDENYLNECDVCLAKDKNGKIVAFTNIIPVYQPGSYSVDLIRYSNHAPKGIMNFVFLELLQLLYNQGGKRFNLGLAPLAGLDDAEQRNLPEDILRFVRVYGSKFYSFKGLEQFKSKFEPEWEDNFIIYQGAPIKLVQISLALLKAMHISKN